MANTYIHTLPDAIEPLNPQGYTIIDYPNIYNEYVTAKVYLSSVSNFFIDNYVSSPEHLETKLASTWVNSNSSNMYLNTLLVSSFGVGSFEQNIITLADNRNEKSKFLLKNISNNENSLIEINFQNSLSAENFRIGTLSENYNNFNFTINNGKNNNYIFSENKNLLIGSQGANKDICIFTGGPYESNERIYIKGDGSGNVGIKTKTPNVSLTVNGSISSSRYIFDEIGNSLNWNQSYSYLSSNSSRNNSSTSFVEFVSSNLVLKTGATLLGSLYTTQTLTGAFAVDELITKRYVDALVFQSNVSGNFVPALYYIKNEIDDFLKNPNSVYGFVNNNSSLDLQSRTFINNNSAILLSLNSTTLQTSGKWQETYFYVNQASAQEEDQTEVTNFILSNSSRSLEVQNYVNSISSNINDLYSSSVLNSSLELDVRTYVNSNSSTINSNISFVNSNSIFWNDATSVTQTYSTQNIDTRSIVNSNSANWNQSYTLYSGNSGSYATYQYVNNGFLPLSGGNVTGRLFGSSFGIGNSETVAGTLGILSRKMEVFDINGNSLGFIPIYGSIT